MTPKQQLEKSQSKLNEIEKAAIENKLKREELREEARKLRDAYIAEEKIREQLLKEVLTSEETK